MCTTGFPSRYSYCCWYAKELLMEEQILYTNTSLLCNHKPHLCGLILNYEHTHWWVVPRYISINLKWFYWYMLWKKWTDLSIMLWVFFSYDQFSECLDIKVEFVGGGGMISHIFRDISLRICFQIVKISELPWAPYQGLPWTSCGPN